MKPYNKKYQPTSEPILDEASFEVKEEIIKEEPKKEKVKADLKVLVDNCAALNLREKPSIEGKVLRILKKGENLTKLQDQADGWSRVRKDGVVGFVMANFLKEM